MSEPIAPKPVALPPFKAWLASNIPAVYDNTMSYYDELTSLIKWLETEVVPNVNEAIALVNMLKEYVENYFKNLDVQEEINNKLDQMAEDGTLQAIITAYLSIAGVLSFTSVANMKLSTNLIDGTYCQTGGFYATGDGGAALYHVRTKTESDSPNEIDLFDLYDSTLVAELVYKTDMNVKQFGAKGDSSTDDTAAIQYAINHCHVVFIPDGTYMINVHYSGNNGLSLVSHSSVTLSENATLKAITNNYTNYAIVNIASVQDVVLTGGNILGDKDTHSGIEGEWGHGISITGASDITIRDVNISKTWGDGIYINDVTDCVNENIKISYARRNGISVIKAKNYRNLNNIITNTSGTAPQHGVDIEPNSNADNLENIVFDNLYTASNAGTGLMIHLLTLDATNTVSIMINNHHDYASTCGFGVTKSTTVKGYIQNINAYYDFNVNQAIILRRCYDGDCNVTITKPVCINYNQAGLTSGNYGAGISGYTVSGDDQDTIGNITINEPIVKTNITATTRAISFTPQAGTLINKIAINDPIDLNGNLIFATGRNVTFYDKYAQCIYTATTNETLQTSRIYSHYVNTASASGNYILTLPADLTVGSELKFTNMSDSYHLRIKIPADQYVTQLVETATPRIVLNNLGESITIKKISSTNWIVTAVNCEPTIE